MNKIIDDTKTILDSKQLDELLLDPKYNKPNLKELIRRLVKHSNEQSQHIKYLGDQIEKNKTPLDN